MRFRFGGKCQLERRSRRSRDRCTTHVQSLFTMADDKDVAEKTIAEDLVVTKYKMAGEIVNRESFAFVSILNSMPSMFAANR